MWKESYNADVILSYLENLEGGGENQNCVKSYDRKERGSMRMWDGMGIENRQLDPALTITRSLVQGIK